MTPTKTMQEIEASRQRLLQSETSKLKQKYINEVADEWQEAEMKRYQATQQVGDIAKDLLKLIQAQNEGL